MIINFLKKGGDINIMPQSMVQRKESRWDFSGMWKIKKIILGYNLIILLLFNDYILFLIF